MSQNCLNVTHFTICLMNCSINIHEISNMATSTVTNHFPPTLSHSPALFCWLRNVDNCSMVEPNTASEEKKYQPAHGRSQVCVSVR